MSFIKFGERVRSRREELGLTQADLAKRVRVKQETIHKIESAKVSDIYSNTLFKLAKALKWDAIQVYEAYNGRTPRNPNDKILEIESLTRNFINQLEQIRLE